MSTQGLVEAPALRFLCSGQQHASIDRAVWLLGLGTDALRSVGTDSRSRLDLHSLQRELAAGADIPSVVCLQAGEINTGAFDPSPRRVSSPATTAHGCTSMGHLVCGRRPVRDTRT